MSVPDCPNSNPFRHASFKPPLSSPSRAHPLQPPCQLSRYTQQTHFRSTWTTPYLILQDTTTVCPLKEGASVSVTSLQNLLQELYQCDPGAEAGEHPVIQGALVLVVMDGYKVVSEIRFRIPELLGRVDTLALSESLAVLHNCKRAAIQMQALQTFLENCKDLRLLSDVPLPGKAMVSKLEIQKLTESIQSLPKEPSVPSLTRSVSTGGQGMTGSLSLQSTARQPLRIDGPGHLQRTSSQPLSQLPRRAPRTNREFSFIPEDVPYARHFSADLIDLSFDTDSSSHVDKSSVSQNTFRDVMTF